ncbi:MAG: hypothetical protein KGL19_07605 [Bacteroidota bacterium]|nr:hypothetical protein [Bacteroidota bacterium]
MANGNFQFIGTQKKSIPQNILINIKNAYNNNPQLNIARWCKLNHFNPGGCALTVLKNLLQEYQ